MNWIVKQKKQNKEKNGSWIVLLTSLIIVFLFCAGETKHILIGVNPNKSVYYVTINETAQYVETTMVPIFEQLEIPPYNSIVVDTMGILIFSSSDSSGVVAFHFVDSGIEDDYWVPENEELNDYSSCYVSIYAVTGRRIAEYQLDIGEGLDYIWEGRDSSGQKVASGIYFVKIEQPDGLIYRKTTVIK